MIFTVQASGVLSKKERQKCADRVRQFAGKTVEIIIRKPESQRSLAQNNYLHSKHGPVMLMADEWGVGVAEAKLLLMGECWGWRQVNGHEIPRRAATREMTVDEFSRFLDWVIPWAQVEWNVRIALPGESLAA